MTIIRVYNGKNKFIFKNQTNKQHVKVVIHNDRSTWGGWTLEALVQQSPFCSLWNRLPGHHNHFVITVSTT